MSITQPLDISNSEIVHDVGVDGLFFAKREGRQIHIIIVTADGSSKTYDFYSCTQELFAIVLCLTKANVCVTQSHHSDYRFITPDLVQHYISLEMDTTSTQVVLENTTLKFPRSALGEYMRFFLKCKERF